MRRELDLLLLVALSHGMFLAEAGAGAPPGSSHRIGVRVVEGRGEFFDTVTGETYVPRGHNYVRANPSGTGHALFKTGEYDAAEVATAMTAMAAAGYNVIRVHVDRIHIEGEADAPGQRLDAAYLTNVVDLVTTARTHGLHVTFNFEFVPSTYDSLRGTPPPNVAGRNEHVMSQGYLEALATFVVDVLEAIRAADATLLTTIFSFNLWNEAAFFSSDPPFSLSAGFVTPAEGGTYDLSIRASRQLAADNGARYFADFLVARLKAAEPQLLLSISVFTPRAAQRTGYDGVDPIGSPIDSRLPFRVRALAASSLDYIDLHLIPTSFPWGLPYDLEAEMAVIEFDELDPAKPLFMGEIGAYKFDHSTVGSAIRTLLNHQARTCDLGFDGWVLWSWDTGELPTIPTLWNAVEEGAAIREALSPLVRPDPCVSPFLASARRWRLYE